MRRAVLEQEVTAAVLPRLAAGEDVVGASAVWVTTPRSTFQRLVSARRLLPAAVTDRRLVLFRPPEDAKIPPGGVALEIPLAQLRLDGVGRLPLLQVRLRAGRTREIVVEFRPRDRWLGRELAAMVRAGADGSAGAPAPPRAPAPANPAPAGNPRPGRSPR